MSDRFAGDIELVAKELWWAQDTPEVPADRERWALEAAALDDESFAVLLARANEEQE